VPARVLGWGVVLLIALLIVLWVLVLPRFMERDLRDVLAEALGVPTDELVLNVPPRPGRYPGAILHSGVGVPVEMVGAEDGGFTGGTPFTLEARHEGITSASGSLATPVFELIIEHERNVELMIRVDPGAILETELPYLLGCIEGTLRADSPAEQQSSIVTSAVEGPLTLELARRQDLSGEAWSSLLSRLREIAAVLGESQVRIGAATESTDTLAISIQEPAVIGFVTRSVSEVRAAGDGLLPAPDRVPEQPPEPDVAIDALMRYGPENIPALRQALSEIGTGADQAVLDAFKDARTRQDAVDQQKALQLYQALPPEVQQVRPEFEQLLQDPGTQESVRVSAAGALLAADPGSARALAVLSGAFGSTDVAAREEAAASIGRGDLRVQLLLPLLQGALEDDDQGVRHEAVRSLGVLGVEARIALPQMRAIIERGEVDPRLAEDAIRRIERGDG
jgi:hypothetical protein